MLKKYIALLLGLFCFVGFAQAKGLNIFAYPRTAPQTPIYNLYGKEVKISDFAGDFLLINFWSRHCIPCIKELGKLNSFSLQTRDSGIKTIIVSRADEWVSVDEQQKFLAKFKAQDLDFYLDKKGKLTEDFGIFSSPHTVIVNKKGEEIGRIRGSADWDDEDVIAYIYKIKAQYGEGNNTADD